MFRRNVVRTALAVALCLTFSATVFGQRDRRGGRWELLGEANVDGGVDHDRIRVSGSGFFRGIQLRVERGPIRFDRVIVHFEDGPGQPIFIRGRISPGSSTRVIDLPGNRRLIRDVEFFYERASWKSGRPKVLLFGIR